MVRFMNLKVGETPPQTAEWIMLRLSSPNFYQLSLAPSLAERLSRKAVSHAANSIAAIEEAEDIAREAGLSIVYVVR